MEEPAKGDTEDQRRDVVPVRDRLGLGCAMFPGCGVCMIALATPVLLGLVRSRFAAGPSGP